jgi:hypothetical protein
MRGVSICPDHDEEGKATRSSAGDRRTHNGGPGVQTCERSKARQPTNLEHAGVLGRATQVATADEFVSGLFPVVLAIRQTGAQTLEAMSQALNQRGIRTARGGNGTRHRSQICLFAQRTSTLQESLL